MKSLVLLLVAGCATEPLVSTTVDDVAVSDLENQGYTCEATSPHESTCSRCQTTTLNDGTAKRSVTVCFTYYCLEDNCTYSGSYEPSSTFTDDLNYWFEAEAGTFVAPMQRLSEDNASGGAGAFVPTTAGAGGSVSFTFTAPVSTTVVPWIRVIAPSTAS